MKTSQILLHQRFVRSFSSLYGSLFIMEYLLLFGGLGFFLTSLPHCHMLQLIWIVQTALRLKEHQMRSFAARSLSLASWIGSSIGLWEVIYFSSQAHLFHNNAGPNVTETDHASHVCHSFLARWCFWTQLFSGGAHSLISSTCGQFYNHQVVMVPLMVSPGGAVERFLG